jgi:glycosyltransferase involved in cell wall biosynthesis
MKVALVAPGSARCSSGSLERRVEDLARGLARQGTDVEVVTQDPGLRSVDISERDGVLTRRFPATGRSLGFATAPGLWEHVRQGGDTWDVVHLHAAREPLTVATRGVGFATRRLASGRLIFTPHAPIQRLLRWPYGPVVRAVVDRAALIVPLSGVEAELIRDIFPHAANRVQTMPMGVDVVAIRAARPLDDHDRVVLAAGPLERRTERVIAAMASLDQRFRLVILEGGPAVLRLRRYADDLEVSERVDFVGPVSASLYYRWLRTARVLVTLTEGDPSGSELLEALTAGASAVASDVAIHREAAAVAGHAGVSFVAPECSPLELADAIAAVAEQKVASPARLRIPSGQTVAECMLGLYRSLTDPGMAERHASANGNGPRPAPRG